MNAPPIAILFITGNEHKRKEFETLIDLPGISLEYRQMDLMEIQSANPEVVGRHKIEQIVHKLGTQLTQYKAVFCDDTSLHLSAMPNALPGPLIKWFLDALTANGLVEFAEQKKDMRATATCTLSAYFTADRSIELIAGKIKGVLAYSRGSKAFGWDSVFIPEGYNRTFGEIDRSLKNKISHRALAVNQFNDILKRKFNQ